MRRRVALLEESNLPPSRALRALAGLAEVFGEGGKVRTTLRAPRSRGDLSSDKYRLQGLLRANRPYSRPDSLRLQ